MLKTPRFNRLCLILALATICSTILLMIIVSHANKTQSLTPDANAFDSWVEAARRKVMAMGLVTEAISNHTGAHQTNPGFSISTPTVQHRTKKPPLYPAGFQLSDLANFTFAVNNDVCGDAVVDIVMIVTSNSRHPSYRSAIRSAMPQAMLEELRIRRVFLLAQLPPPADKNEYDKRLAAQHAENHEHGDLVSGNFHDAYRNLTYKHLMGLHWASTYCPQAAYILKMDDDITLDIFQIRQRLSSAPRTMTAIGALFGGTRPIRDPDSKWYVPKSEFPADFYPSYMSGWLYVITRDAAASLVAAAREEPFFWVDDAFVTGVLREKRVPDLKMYDMDQLWGQPDDTDTTTSPFTMEIDCVYQCAVAADSSRGQCDTLVGPAWENLLVLRLFMKQAEYCYRHGCQRRQHMPDVCHGDTNRQRHGMPQSEADIGDVSER